MSDNSNTPQELTVRVIFFGVILAVLLSAANAYLGLFAGMTVSAAIPAAVMALGIMRFFRTSTIQECNLVGTCASAGESLAAGVIFTLPALLLLGFWDEFHYIWVATIAGFGGLLGVLFTIPLRRSLIIEQNLQFPEGVATAKVLETGRKDTSGIKYIVRAAIAGGLFKVGANAVGIWPEIMQGAVRAGGSIAYFGSNLSPALLSVGFIVGLNIAVLIFVGGAANWLVTIPIVAAVSDWPTYASGENAGQAMSALDYAARLWSTKTRYVGVGGMLVGGLWTIFRMRKSLISGMTSGLQAYKQIKDGKNEIDRTERDLPMGWIIFLIIGSVVPLFMVYQHFVQQIHISAIMAVVMLATGFLFAAVAGYMAGLVGSSNNPISGVTVSTVLVSSLLLVLLMGKAAENGPAAAIIIGSVVCCAAAIAGDVMQDLKCGRLVGTTPWKQQVMEMVGTVSGALVIARCSFCSREPTASRAWKAPVPRPLHTQANLMASVARGVFEGGLPWAYVFGGMFHGRPDHRPGHVPAGQEVPVPHAGPGGRHRVLSAVPVIVPIFAGGLVSMAVGMYHRRKQERCPGEGGLRAPGPADGLGPHHGRGPHGHPRRDPDVT